MKGIAVFIVFAFVVSEATCYLIDDVYRDVFTGYHSATRPLCYRNDVTDVYIDFALRQIVDLDEPHQFLNSIIWVRMQWTDCRLSWNVSDYDNITAIVLPEKTVWVPDLTLYDSSAANRLAGLDGYKLVVHNNGVINYNFPSLIRSVCAVDVTHFPFDHQTCNLTFGSWAYSGKQVDLINVSSEADISAYNLNSEWILYKVPVIREVTMYGDDPYPTLVVRLLLERRPLFYTLNLLFPCFLISSVAVLGFLLPPASGEKVNLEITVLLSLAVFQLIVLDLMPPSGKVSFMGLYFIISMIFVGFSCFATVVVLNVHFKGYDLRPLPDWIRRRLLNPLARLTCVNVEKRREERYSISHSRRASSVLDPPGTFRRHSLFPPIDESSNHVGDFMHSASHYVNGEVTNVGGNTGEGSHTDRRRKSISRMPKQIVKAAHSLNECLENINKHIEEQQCQSDAGCDWITFALVLDRIFMVTYVLFLLAGSLTLYIKFILLSHVPEHWTH